MCPGRQGDSLEPDEKERYTEKDIVDRFGIHPHFIPNYLALAGDKSDGIPGLPGCGPKAARTLIERYGPIEEFPDDPETWDVTIRGKERLGILLRQRRNEVILHRNLSTLRTDVPIPDTLADLEWKGADMTKTIVEILEDPSLLDLILLATN